jgi:hypothetical protein
MTVNEATGWEQQDALNEEDTDHIDDNANVNDNGNANRCCPNWAATEGVYEGRLG